MGGASSAQCLTSGSSPDQGHPSVWPLVVTHPTAIEPLTQTWSLVASWILSWHRLFAQVPHICALLTTTESLVPPFSTVYEPLSFAFSPILLPWIPSFPSPHHTFAHHSGTHGCLGVFLLATWSPLGQSKCLSFFWLPWAWGTRVGAWVSFFWQEVTSYDS